MHWVVVADVGMGVCEYVVVDVDVSRKAQLLTLGSTEVESRVLLDRASGSVPAPNRC